jgi:putative thiamine transport system permease protein
LYLPLLIPQIAFLFGAQIWLVLVGLDGRWVALTWLHLVFVFPYVFLALADSYRAWDPRYKRTGLCLGASPYRIFLRIKLPMLVRPVTAAWAVGFAVSVGLYLPTLLGGNGRYPTLTTEAVTLSAGGDNRLIGVYALLQMTLPLLGFILATVVPGCLFRNRRGMQVTT